MPVKVATIRSYPTEPNKPDEIEGYVNESEMLACFTNELLLNLFRDELTEHFVKELTETLEKIERTRKFYQKKQPTREEYLELVQDVFRKVLGEEYIEVVNGAFRRMLRTVRTRAKVRGKP